MRLIISILLCTLTIAQNTKSGNLFSYQYPQNKSELPVIADKQKTDEISVRNFGAIPDDGKDDAQAILLAIEHAKSAGIQKLLFEAGIYDFKTLPGWERTERKRLCYVSLREVNNLELSGAVNTEGKPATFWIKKNDLKECQPMIISIEKGSNVTVRNIAVDFEFHFS